MGNGNNNLAPLDLVLSRLHGVKPGRNGNWQARCPAHDDRIASLSVSVGSDQRVLLNCFAGCEATQIVERLDLKMADLFPPREDTPKDKHEPGRKLGEQRYAICDADGQVIAYHYRVDYEYAKRIWWEQANGTRGLGSIALEDLPLYGTHEVPSDGGRAIFVVEGEKARDALADLGISVVGTYGADHVPSLDPLLSLMRFEQVYLWPDRDRAGLLHMRTIAERLRDLGHVNVTIIVDPDAEWKDDAADWVDRGGDLDGLRTLAQTGRPLAEFLDTSTIEGTPSPAALYTPADSQQYTINGVTYEIQYKRRLSSGIEATIAVITGHDDLPMIIDRVNLDRSHSREEFASKAGVDAQDLMTLRSLIIRDIEQPGGDIEINDARVWTDIARSRLEDDSAVYYRTGYGRLDMEISGMQNQQLVIIAGQTGSGKTSFMLNLLAHNLMRGYRCGMISMEMSGEEITGRLISIRSGKSYTALKLTERKLEDVEQDIQDAIDTLSEKPLYLIDSCPSTLPAVLDLAHRLKEERNIDMLFIDQIHSIAATEGETRNELAGKIANSFKQLARQLDIPVIAAAQMNRQQTFRKDKWPILDDIRDSAEIAHQADIVMFVHHPYMFDENEPDKIAYFVVGKNREGKIGGRVQVRWVGYSTTFEPMS